MRSGTRTPKRSLKLLGRPRHKLWTPKVLTEPRRSVGVPEINTVNSFGHHHIGMLAILGNNLVLSLTRHRFGKVWPCTFSVAQIFSGRNVVLELRLFYGSTRRVQVSSWHIHRPLIYGYRNLGTLSGHVPSTYLYKDPRVCRIQSVPQELLVRERTHCGIYLGCELAHSWMVQRGLAVVMLATAFGYDVSRTQKA